MKLKFQKRISGLAKVCWETRELECESYEVRPPGTTSVTPNGTKFTTGCWSIRTISPDSGWFELRPGSVQEIK